LEEDGSDFYEDEMAMITRKFKKFFKKAEKNSKKKNVIKPRGNECELDVSSVENVTIL